MNEGDIGRYISILELPTASDICQPVSREWGAEGTTSQWGRMAHVECCQHSGNGTEDAAATRLHLSHSRNAGCAPPDLTCTRAELANKATDEPPTTLKESASIRPICQIRDLLCVSVRKGRFRRRCRDCRIIGGSTHVCNTATLTSNN